MKKGFILAATVAVLLGVATVKIAQSEPVSVLDADAVRQAFGAQSLQLDDAQLNGILPEVRLAVTDLCAQPVLSSKTGFAAVQIAQNLKLNPKIDHGVVTRIETALKTLAATRQCPHFCTLPVPVYPTPQPEPVREPDLTWEAYYNQTLALNQDQNFLSLVQGKGYSPVKISWEDISRYQGSVWGDRISDVGIWVRRDEHDPGSAELALSVRRDENYRDKVLMVPADKIKIHRKEGARTMEVSLPQRLKELGLASPLRDQHVIVSNQFAVVPVPAARLGSNRAYPSRSAFNFSIFPYGATNYVITDVIEGSSEAIVGPGNHQLLYANVHGKKAPFTASRAAERPDLLRLEAELKALGMDVDVQRYYLIQIPLKRHAGITLANMGTPPWRGFNAMSDGFMAPQAAPAETGVVGAAVLQKTAEKRADSGLVKVAIGHGDSEGVYNTGSGYRGQRADEPVRVTVVYFVTPVGAVTQADMNRFADAFQAWDAKAVWGGSFVTPGA
ncbi:MAG: hypothetical protein AB7P76_11805 [Candidatus Melainabacteria bacterium]